MFRILAPCCVVLVAFCLLGCMGEEGPEYNVHVRDQVQSVQFKVDADGTPIFMAQVGMFYTTKGPPPQYGYIPMEQSNLQTVVYSRREGNWREQSFRNLQAPWESNSMLLRGAAGGVQPLVWDRPRLSLYESKGSEWISRKTVNLEASGISGAVGMSSYGMYSGFFYDGMVLLDGDSAWLSVRNSWDNKARLVVQKMNGSLINLDSNFSFSSTGSLSVDGFNFIIGSGDTLVEYHDGDLPVFLDTASHLVYYSWSSTAPQPTPKKKIIQIPKRIMSGFFAKVLGEDRFYGTIGLDSLLEFAVRNRELVFIANHVLAPFPFELEQDGKWTPWESNIAVDAMGCIHRLKRRTESRDFHYGYPQEVTMGYLHKSTCREGVDSLELPKPIPLEEMEVNLSGLQFSKTGNPMVALTILRSSVSPNNSNYSIPPSWIYLGELTESGKWAWEKVAEY